MRKDRQEEAGGSLRGHRMGWLSTGGRSLHRPRAAPMGRAGALPADQWRGASASYRAVLRSTPRRTSALRKTKKKLERKMTRERERERAPADNLLHQLHRHRHRRGVIGSAIGTTTIVVRVTTVAGEPCYRARHAIDALLLFFFYHRKIISPDEIAYPFDSVRSVLREVITVLNRIVCDKCREARTKPRFWTRWNYVAPEIDVHRR